MYAAFPHGQLDAKWKCICSLLDDVDVVNSLLDDLPYDITAANTLNCVVLFALRLCQLYVTLYVLYYCYKVTIAVVNNGKGRVLATALLT